ncbi:MAG: hypothetical protein KAH32_06130 [Chlamydiia bacterium]|nr:hypothetical protein [Chlamydiia bacterium]
MKKLVLAIAVVASFASCEKQAKQVETGMLSITPLVEGTNNVDKKSGDVERGTTPVYVSGIEVTTNMNGLTTDNHFNIVEDGAPGAASGYVIEDVPLGMNTISAVTNPADDVRTRRVFFTTSSDAHHAALWNASEAWGAIVAEAVKLGYWWANKYNVDNVPPYAIYEGSTTALLVDDEVADVHLDMDTDYGRSIYSIGFENVYDLNAYNVEISSKFYDKNDNEVYNHQVVIDRGNQATMGLWSDELSVEGAYIKLELQWRADGASDVLKSAEVIIPIRAKKDMYSKIVINRTSFVVEQTGLTFSYDPIVPGDEDIIIE